MSDANTNYGGAGNDTLLMDFNIFNQRRTSMLSAVDRLVFDTRPSQMEGKVCGTETIMELMSQWDKVAKTSMNFRDFYMGCVDKSLVETADSIYATNDQVANALNIFGDSTNVFGSVQGDDTLVEMLANQDPGDIDSINGLENAGDQDPGYLAALHAAQLQSGNNLNKVEGAREEFMKRYNVDEATMERVEKMVENGKNGKYYYLNKWNKYQKFSEREWANLEEDQAQEFTDLVVLNAYANYMIENDQDNLSASELEAYKTISEKTIQKMYYVDAYGSARVNTTQVGAMKVAYASMGAEDTLAYNILLKIGNDTSTYYLFDPATESKAGQEVIVEMTYDERGFASIYTYDSGAAEFSGHRQILATSRDNATKHLEQVRATVNSYDTHGMSDDELIGMIQVAENPNDLQIAENIAKSDHEFKINGKNAFDIDYWEDSQRGVLSYSEGVSNSFSITLGQMGANMIYKGDFENYKEFLNAIMIESAKENGHDIVLDIASGAGIYADTCGQMVIDDEIGGDNDKELEKRLNAAADNFGLISKMHAEFNTGMFSEYKIKDISDVGYEKGKLSLNFTADKKTLFFTDKDEDIAVETKVVTGVIGLGEMFEKMQEDLRNELDRKRQELLISTAIDVVGIVNPTAKNVLTVAYDIASEDNATTDTVDMIKDSVKFGEKGEKGVTFGNTILGGVFKYADLLDKYQKDSKKIAALQKMMTYYSYNTGSDTVGLYDYDNIRKAQQWGENGISQIAKDCDLSNEEIYDEVYGQDSLDQYNKDVVRTIAEDLCGSKKNKIIINRLGPKAHDFKESDYDAVYELIEEKAGYTKEEIDNAMQVAIYGHSDNADAEYQTVTDVPQDLMYACLDALEDNYNIDAFTYWG